MRSGTVLAIAAAVTGCGPLAAAQPARPNTCPPTGAALVVDTSVHTLWLCRDGRADHTYKVSIGSAGVGKQREGDNRTPLGVYTLDAPVESEQFHTFIPVGYPTEAQRRDGLTGSAIGVHGPTRRSAWLGRFNTWTDWTRGCIAVGSDRDISEIASWVAHERATQIVITQ